MRWSGHNISSRLVPPRLIILSNTNPETPVAASISGPANAPARRTCRRGYLPWQCSGRVPRSAVRTIGMSAASRGGGFTPAGLSLAAHRPMVGPTNDIKIYVRYFFRHGRWQPTARITQGPHGRYAGRPAPAQAAQVLTSQMFCWTDANSSAMLFNSEPFPQGYIFEQGQAPNGNASNQTARSRGTCSRDGAGSALAEQATRGRPILAPSG